MNYENERLRVKLDDMLEHFNECIRPEVDDFVAEADRRVAMEDIVDMIAMEQEELDAEIDKLNDLDDDALFIHKTLTCIKADQFLKLVLDALAVLDASDSAEV